MNFLENCNFTNKQIKELEEDIPGIIKKSLLTNKRLVEANLKYLSDLGTQISCLINTNAPDKMDSKKWNKLNHCLFPIAVKLR